MEVRDSLIQQQWNSIMCFHWLTYSDYLYEIPKKWRISHAGISYLALWRQVIIILEIALVLNNIIWQAVFNSFSSVQSSHSVISSSLWLHGLQRARPPCLSLTPRAYSNHVHWVGDGIQPSYPLSSPSPPAFNLFTWVSSSHQGPKYCSFTFSISPSTEPSGLISFRMDWLKP